MLRKFLIKMVNFLSVRVISFPVFNWVGPDPHSEYGSGSTKLLNTDPTWIRIHYSAESNIRIRNTSLQNLCFF